ncbi:Ferritin-like domain-containing protein [Actinopolyspora alba]|uniref:Ferritin-like domain-containing protein n=1 Tax=Actinopolyspora alba TaxID=673379 RepID=A0A1I1Y9A6_9ACTN|nr:ferritin-like domain-containing protein [Actinopolyspora alba]SFE16215.1 Ferritin-like domain-containing protein [Actinopolyspora alba]
MFGKSYLAGMINRSSETDSDRRHFLRTAGLGGLGVAGAAAASSAGLGTAGAAETASRGPGDGAVLNFALNLEYLEGQFYSYAVHGVGLPEELTTGKGDRGTVTGGHAVPFESSKARQYATEIAADERAHIEFLRSALGSAKVAQPRINLRESFTAAARAAGLIGEGQEFDPFANEDNFLLAAYLFEDVGVTAYKGPPRWSTTRPTWKRRRASWRPRPTTRPTSAPCCTTRNRGCWTACSAVPVT